MSMEKSRIFETTTLDVIRQKQEVRYGSREMVNTKVFQYEDMINGDIKVRIERWFVGQHMPEAKFKHLVQVEFDTIENPKTWWDHFKHEHGNGWFMRQVIKLDPIQYDRVRPRKEFEITNLVAFNVIYPDFKQAIQGDFVIVPRYSEYNRP